MITGSLGLRSSGSYGSLPVPQFQIGYSLPNQPSPPVSSRKPPKMFKEKDRMFHWISRFAPRKKLGMLLLGAISAVVFIWVLYYDKEGGVQQGNIDIQFNSSFGNGGYSPISVKIRSKQDNVSLDGNNGESGSIVVELPQSLPPPSPVLPAYFKGYTLPPGNPCEHFTLPPPPADPKRTGPRPCPVCYLPIEQVLDLMPSAPSFSPILKNLTYIHEDKLTKTEFGGSEFGGYPSLSQRNDSYDIKESMSVHCGFVRGVKPGRGTGFDINDFDLVEMESCQGVVVASAIFGAFDVLHQPQNVSDYANRTVCFYMFVDEETESFLKNSISLDESKKIGLWRIVVVHNLPFSDPRRNGKVPKLLLHRLFPNARYSLWIDGKLKLVVDPYQVLERFLWRKNSSFAISRHYRRFDVFVEAEANKAAGKYENDSIDFQIEFYKKEGLTPYSSAKLPITSDVPEGCVIIKEHIPITNLFTCLWFNEVDRFTSRDQISFSTVRDKIWSVTNWTLNMFLDCERRNFVVQDYHRDLLEHMAHPPPPPPPLVVATASRDEILKNTTAEISTGIILDDPTRIILDDPTKKTSPRRGKDRKSKRHRKVVAGSKGIG